MGENKEYPCYRFTFTITATSDTTEDYMISTSPILEDYLKMACNAKAYSFQIERGIVAGKLHFQGRMSVRNPKKTANQVVKLLKFFIKSKPLWQVHVEQERDKGTLSELYTRKPDTALPGTFVTSYKQFAADYTADDLYLNTNQQGKYKWQYQLEDHLNAPFGTYEDVESRRKDFRMIDILSDPRGNHGKSVFIKRYLYKYGRDVFFIPVVDNPTQIVSAFISFVEANGNVGPKVVLIDIPRAIDIGNKDGSVATMIKIHNIAEILRAGLVTSAMYGKYKQIIVTPPRVLIMTNYNYNGGKKDHLWCPPNRFIVHRLQEASNDDLIIPTLIR